MNLPNRKRTRLKEYDYSTPGAYFVTICTKDKKCLLSKIVGEGVSALPQNILTNIGKTVNQEILKIELHYANVRVDKYVIMPNHIHMIIVISETEGINPFPTIKCDISNIVGKFKAGVSRIVGNAFMHSAENELWQKSFHDHIIRGEEDYQKIWQYIDTNHLKWEQDKFYIKE